MFTIVVPFFNGHHHLDKLLGSIPAGIRVVVVDDQSDQPLAKAGRAEVIRNEIKGYFAGAVNRGLREIPAGDVLILNQDVYFTGPGWLNLIEQNRARYGLIGEGVLKHPAWPAGYIHGTFMYIRRDVLDAVGQLEAEWYPLWGNTCEYQLRAARKGFKALAVPQGQIPDFVHTRQQGQNGESITRLLQQQPDRRGLFIRTPPMISVVINCYNHGQFLQDAIHSLIGGPTCLGDMPGQTFQGFEVIIVDDGSTDNTPEVGRQLADPAKGIHYVRQNNNGSAVAMNTGIERARGKYIAAMDADDMMAPGRLETMLRAQEKNPHAVIYDDVAYFSQQGQKWIKGWREKAGWTEVKRLPRVYDFEQILYKNGMHKGLMYPRRAWEEVGGYPAVMNRGREDWAINVAFGIKGWCGVHTGQAQYLYRRNWTSRTFANTTPEWRAVFLEQMKQLFPNIYGGERPIMCCGKRTNSTPKKPIGGAGVAMMKALPGAKAGMIILEYIGKNAGDETWYGEVTRTTYRLGGVTRRGYVAREDAGERPGPRSDGKGMLNIREGGRYLFREWTPPATPVLKVEIMEDTTVVNLPVVVPAGAGIAAEPANISPDTGVFLEGEGEPIWAVSFDQVAADEATPEEKKPKGRPASTKRGKK